MKKNSHLLYKPQDELVLPKVKPDSLITIRKKSIQDYKKNDEKFANNLSKLTNFLKENKSNVDHLQWKDTWLDEWSWLQSKCLELEHSIAADLEYFGYNKESEQLQKQRYDIMLDLVPRIYLEKSSTKELKTKNETELKNLVDAEDFISKELEIFVSDYLQGVTDQDRREENFELSSVIPLFEFEDGVLRKEFEIHLQQKREEYKINLKLLTEEYYDLKNSPILNGSAANVFVKVYKYLERRQQKRVNKTELSQLLLQQCRSLEIVIDKEKINNHFDWYMKIQSLKWRIRDTTEIHKQHFQTSCEKMTQALQLASELNKQKQKVDEEKLIIEKKKLKLHEQLSLMHEQRQSNENSELEQLKLEIDMEAANEKQKAEKRRQQIKKKLQQYYDKQVEQKKEQLQKQEDYASYLATQKDLQKKNNQERVQFRAEKYELKKEEQKKNKFEIQQREEERLIRFEKLKQQVDLKLQHIQPDFDRLVKPIASHLTEPSPITAKLFSTNGYTDKELFKDKRFRLQTAIYEAGLLNSPYAAQVFQLFSKSSQ